MKLPYFKPFTLDLHNSPLMMGILNVTPDSFSDGGRYCQVEAVAKQWKKLTQEGAHIIDLGGESTRPGATTLSAEEEIQRLKPFRHLVEQSSLPVSIDTYHGQTAATLLDWGAKIVNDVWGLQKDPLMGEVVASAGCPICLMANLSQRGMEGNVMDCVKRSLELSLSFASKAGIRDQQILIDPGIGFGMEPHHGFEVLRRLSELKSFGRPIVLGTSRKRLLGSLFDSQPQERDVATAATTVWGVLAGVEIFRVHNVKVNREAAMVALKLRSQGEDFYG